MWWKLWEARCQSCMGRFGPTGLIASWRPAKCTTSCLRVVYRRIYLGIIPALASTATVSSTCGLFSALYVVDEFFAVCEIGDRRCVPSCSLNRCSVIFLCSLCGAHFKLVVGKLYGLGLSIFAMIVLKERKIPTSRHLSHLSLEKWIECQALSRAMHSKLTAVFFDTQCLLPD